MDGLSRHVKKFRQQLHIKNDTILNAFQRLGACYFKRYRKFYQLHKRCIFKFGCTFFIVLIQIMCDRKFKFCKNQPRETDYSSSSEEDQDNDVSNKLSTQKKTPKNIIQTKNNIKRLLLPARLTLVVLILVIALIGLLYLVHHLTHQACVKLLSISTTKRLH